MKVKMTMKVLRGRMTRDSLPGGDGTLPGGLFVAVTVVLRALYCCLLLVYSVIGLPAFGQEHVSVPVDDPVYRLLDLAELRGLCGPLPRVRPYTRKIVRELLAGIEATEAGARGALSQTERAALREAARRFEPAADKPAGLDLPALAYRLRGEAGLPVSVEAAIGVDMTVSGAYYFEDNAAVGGLDLWPGLGIAGDVGGNLSFGMALTGGLLYADREDRGLYAASNQRGDYQEEHGETAFTRSFGQPGAFFPYSYRPGWDHAVWNLAGLTAVDDVSAWPDGLAAGYATSYELGFTFLGGALTARLGRFRRDWAGESVGNSLVLNANAQPFFGVEFNAALFPWLNFSSLTGFLEYAYHDGKGRKSAAATLQNAYSLTQVEARYKRLVSLSLGSAVVWPKRFDLAYVFPLADKLLYQNNVGDYDSTALFGSLRLQYPGVARGWASLFVDEINLDPRIFELDREQFAAQAGVTAALPLLPFASVSLIYTKIEPYCYTHPAITTPWYGGAEMEEAFVNHGEPLGYYLKPNSDELKALFSFMLTPRLSFSAGYQMIRHGADYGGMAVDGSSYYSQMDADRNDDLELRKFFLHDGAYEWSHIVRAGISWAIAGTPLTLSADVGIAHSYFTAIDGEPNSGEAFDYHVIDTAEYPKTTGVILGVGLRFAR